MTPSIAVVGAGLVGATAALALSRRFEKYQIHWLDRRSIQIPPTPSHFDSRVIACTPGSQSFLESLGVWQAIDPARVQYYQSMRVWDLHGSAGIEFQASEVGADNLGAIVEVDELLRGLFKQISQQANVRQWPNTEVHGLTDYVDNQRSLMLSTGETLECGLVVGADGSRSALREQANIKTRIRAMGQTAMVALVTHRNPHRSTAWQAFGKNGPLAFLPLPNSSSGEHQSAIVWSLDDAVAETIKSTTDSELIPLLEAAIDHRLGTILGISHRVSFALNQLHAQHYVRSGLCLVGDAIHTLHPLAGQGANLGLRDVQALDKELQRARQRGVEIGHKSILRRYERARKLESLAMLASMEAFRHGFGSRFAALRWICSAGMGQVNRWEYLKLFLARQAMH